MADQKQGSAPIHARARALNDALQVVDILLESIYVSGDARRMPMATKIEEMTFETVRRETRNEIRITSAMFGVSMDDHDPRARCVQVVIFDGELDAVRRDHALICR